VLALRFPKSTLGAIVDVTIQPSADAVAATGRPAPAPIKVKMLLDTGADQTALDEGQITQWGLIYVSMAFIGTMNGTRPARSYELQLQLSAPGAKEAWAVGPLIVMSRPSFAGLPYVGLIGRDILDRVVFTYDGPAHRCAIEVPNSPLN
jgi:hypothetical protein